MDMYTWADIKAFANSLSENQLNNPVRWWGCEIHGHVEQAKGLEEDYVDINEEGYAPISEYDGLDFENNELSACPRLVCGTPILFVEEDSLFATPLKGVVEKSEKWDKLDKEISKFYLPSPNGTTNEDEGNLCEIGEIAAGALGYM